MPPYVQTTLLGERQANDSRAMPLDDFMQILFPLQFQRFSFQRFSFLNTTRSAPPLKQAKEQYEKFFEQFNDRTHK